MEERYEWSAAQIKSLLYRIIDDIDLAEQRLRLPDCNDCGIKNTCEFVPEPGERVRTNCAHWEPEKKAED